MKITKKEKVFLRGNWIFEIRKGNKKTGKPLRTIRATNIVPSVGLNAIAAQFGKPLITKDIGDNFFIAVGNDATTPVAGNTQLGNETARKAISDRNDDGGNVAEISVFYAPGEATGTHKEFGLFGDGDTTATTAATDSGILYSHVLADVSVAAPENLTISFSLTIST